MSDMVPELSIIIPVYMVENYLSKCLDSILCQMPDRMIEIICIYDDCNDGSLEILERYADKYHCIIILKGRKCGLSGARNDGIRKATGELIWFIDSDDSIRNDACQIIWQEYLKNQFDVLVFGTELIPKGKNIPAFYIDSLYTRNVTYDCFKPDALFRECGAKPFVWRNCFRRKFLVESGVWFDEKNLVGEDLTFQMELFPKARRIIFIKDRIYRHLWKREGSLQDSYLKDKVFQMQGHIRIVENVTKHWKEENYSYTQWTYLYKWAIDFLGEEIPEFGNECLINAALDAISAVREEALGMTGQSDRSIRLSALYKKEMNSFTTDGRMKRNSWIYSLRHAIASRGILRFLYLGWNRIQRRDCK